MKSHFCPKIESFYLVNSSTYEILNKFLLGIPVIKNGREGNEFVKLEQNTISFLFYFFMKNTIINDVGRNYWKVF